jgi:hypothetical protein
MAFCSDNTSYFDCSSRIFARTRLLPNSERLAEARRLAFHAIYVVVKNEKLLVFSNDQILSHTNI